MDAVDLCARKPRTFGMFVGSQEKHAEGGAAYRTRRRVISGVKRLVFGECGHAWRVAYSFLDTLAGPVRLLDPNYPVPQHHLRVHLNDLIAEGQAALRQVEERRVPPDLPRQLQRRARARAWATKPGRPVRDSARDPAGDLQPLSSTWRRRRSTRRRCAAAAAAGLLTDELMDVRVKGAQPHACAR